MTPEQFIAKWQANRRGERQSAQEHFIDLCRLLDEAIPNTDPDGSTYAFEKGATKALGGRGWADVWRKGCFAWEYKGKLKDLDGPNARSFRQTRYLNQCSGLWSSRRWAEASCSPGSAKDANYAFAEERNVVQVLVEWTEISSERIG